MEGLIVWGFEAEGGKPAYFLEIRAERNKPRLLVDRETAGKERNVLFKSGERYSFLGDLKLREEIPRFF